MMSSQNSASVNLFSITSSASSSSSSSDSCESFVTIDRFADRRCLLNRRYNKYESRISMLTHRLKALRSQVLPLPPKMEESEVEKEVKTFSKKLTDDRLFSEVVLSPGPSSKDEDVKDYPVVKDVRPQIEYLQKQLNKTKWRYNKCHNQLIKLSYVESNYNKVYNTCSVPINSSDSVSDNVEIPYQPFRSMPTSCKTIKIRQPKSSFHHSIFGLYSSTCRPNRDDSLLKRLTTLLKIKKYSRSKKSLFNLNKLQLIKLYYRDICDINAYPQMDAHGEANEIEIDKRENTVLTTQREVSKGVSIDVIHKWENLATTDHFSTFEQPLNRWLKLKTFSWSPSGVDNRPVGSFKLIANALVELKDSPMFIPFRNHRYWCGDINLRFSLNSNKFQVGSLQISYLYAPDREYKCSDYRQNIFSLSQTNHCILNAGSSNEGLLHIPFKYHNPLISTQETFSHCYVFISVLNPMLCTSNTYNKASLTVFINLENCKFTGTLDSKLVANPDMFHLIRAICKTTEFGLNQIDPDSNRDNPPDVLPPSYLAPTNVSSWSYGSSISEPINSLRLLADGQTPHPNLTYEEMTVSQLVRVFGLQTQQEWITDRDTGNLLLNLEAAPLGDYSQYPSYVVTNNNQSFKLRSLPPVAVLSSLYSYWRGSLELRIDVVASQFHTGSLLVAYLPGIFKDVKIDQARSSNYVICDIQEQQSFTIVIPYISDCPMHCRKYNQAIEMRDEIEPPGSIQIFVLNRLIPNDQIPNKVYLNFYLRGGEDFELLVPVQPSITTPFNLAYKDDVINILQPNYDSSAYNTANKILTLSFIKFSDFTGYGLCTFNDNTTVSKSYIDFRDKNVKGGSSEDRTSMWMCRDPSLPKPNFYIQCLDFDKIFHNDQTNQYYFLFTDTNQRLGTQFTTMFLAKNKSSAIAFVNGSQQWDDVKECAKRFSNIADVSILNRSFTNVVLTKLYPITDDCLDNFSIISSVNIEERESPATPILRMTESLPSTSSGLTVFGENFGDLKDYCRRYQYYTTVILDEPNLDRRKQVGCLVPLLPQGLVNPLMNADGKIDHIVNRCKDGVIPIIASGYRFYRGSLRYRITVHSKENVNVWIQHRPDMLLKNLQTQRLSETDERVDDYFNHGYAFYVQNTAINTVINIEIPWYNRNMLAYAFYPLLVYKDRRINEPLSTFSLGSLAIGLDYVKPNTGNVYMDIYYSLGDDFHFNTFQGFPLMLPLNQIPDVITAYPQIFNIFTKTNTVVDETQSLVQKGNETLNHFNDVIGQLPKLISENFCNISSSLKNIIFECFSQFIHTVINPTIATISVAIASVMIKIGILTQDLLSSFCSLVTRFFNLLSISDNQESQPSTSGTPSRTEQLSGDEASVNSDNDESAEVCASIGSLLWCGLTSLLNFNSARCNSFKSYLGELTNGITKGSINGNIIFRFLKNNFNFLEKCYKAIIRKINWRYSRYLRLEVEQKAIIKWLDLCETLLQPDNFSLIQNNLKWRESLYSAARYGHLYFCQQLKGKKPAVDAYIRKIHNDIITLRDTLQKEKIFPSLRQEAYGLWLDGASGIGKSTLVTRLSSDLLHSIDYKCKSSLVFNLNATDKYWSNCDQQPVILIDDAFAVMTPESVMQQLWAYFQVMSPVPLIPPMADLKDKKNHYNPEIFVTCSNQAFPSVVGLAHEEALFRRRHQLVNVAVKKGLPSEYPYGQDEEGLKEFKHLEFKLALDVKKRNTSYGPSLTYLEFIEIVKKDFLQFKIRSARSYEERKRLQYAFWPDDDVPILDDFQSIDEFVTKHDLNKKVQLLSVQTEFGPVRTVNDELKNIRKAFVDYLQEKGVKESELLIPEAQVKIISTEVVNPSNGIQDLVQSPEEQQAERREVEIAESRLREELKECDIPELEELSKTIDEEMPKHSSLLMLEYKKKFSSYISLALSFYKENICLLNEFSTDNPELWVIVNKTYNKYPVDNIYINQITKKTFNTCVHHLLSPNSDYVVRRLNGLNVPLWKVFIEKKYDRYHAANTYFDTPLYISDCPCSSLNCIVLSDPLKWESLVSCWYNRYLYFNPNFISDYQFPIINNLKKKISNTKLYFHLIQKYIYKIVKFSVYDVLYKTSHWFGKVISNIGLFVTGLATLLGFVGAYRMSRPQLISSGDTTTASPTNVRNLVFSKFIPLASPQLGSDTNLSQVITKRILNNTVYIVLENKNVNKVSNMKCLVLKDRYLLILRHYYEFIKYYQEGSTINIMWSTALLPFNIDDYTIDWCQDSNYGILKLSSEFSQKKSIVPFIASKKKLTTSIAVDCEIIDIQLDKALIYNEKISVHKDLSIAPTSYSKHLRIPNVFKYKRNYPGMCGSVLFCNELVQTPIIGIHVAGNNGNGYAEPICKELFDDYFEPKEDKIIDWREMEVEQLPIEKSKIYLNGSHVYLGTVDNFYAKTESGITAIEPSTIHGIFPVLTQPGPLSPRDPRIKGKFSPLREGCEKHCNVTKNFNINDLNNSFEDYNSLICHKMLPIRLDVHPLSESESINGLQLDGYEKMALNTSEGFPLSRFRPEGATNKKWLFSFDENELVNGIHPNLREILDCKDNDRKNGVVPLTVHEDCLKDARLPLDKITIPGKVRVFSISPVDFTIQFRQYFLDFIASFKKYRFDVEHGIGMNIHCTEWTDLALMFKDKFIITGDYSGFGPTLNANVVQKAFQIILNWYKKNKCRKEDNDYREILIEELINSVHLMVNYLYKVLCGLPSGNPATVVMNSMVNSLYLRCAWLDIMRKTRFNSMVDFRRCIRLITYGDDLIMSVHPDVIEYFNNNTLSFFFNKHNIKFTDAAKNNINVAPYVSLDTASFLKHTFNPHPFRHNMFIPKLDIVSVQDCCNWIRKSPDRKQATYDNCVQATMLAYGHGPEFYAEFVNKIQTEWTLKYNDEFIARTWNQLDDLFLEQGFSIKW